MSRPNHHRLRFSDEEAAILLQSVRHREETRTIEADRKKEVEHVRRVGRVFMKLERALGLRA